MSKKLLFSLVVLAGFIICAVDSFFIVNQAQQALVLQFGEYKTIHTTPGVKFKIPFIQEVSYLEKRVVEVVPPIPQVLLSDQKRIVRRFLPLRRNQAVMLSVRHRYLSGK